MAIVAASTPVISVATNSSVKGRAPAVGIGITACPGVNPCVRRFAIHPARHSLVRPAPGEEDRVLRHAIPNLAFAHERLIARRETLKLLGMLGNPRLSRDAAGEEKDAACCAQHERVKNQAPLHGGIYAPDFFRQPPAAATILPGALLQPSL